MTAHLTKVKGGYLLYISPTIHAADFVQCERVKDKKHAREVARVTGCKAVGLLMTPPEALAAISDALFGCWSPALLAAELGVSERTVRRWRAGSSIPLPAFGMT